MMDEKMMIMVLIVVGCVLAIPTYYMVQTSTTFHFDEFKGSQGNLQGIASNGDDLYIVDTESLTIDGYSVELPYHACDPVFVDGYIYIPITNYLSWPYENSILVYDTGMELVEEYSLNIEAWASSIAYDNDKFYISCFNDPTIYIFTSFFDSQSEWDSDINEIQGIEADSGVIYILAGYRLHCFSDGQEIWNHKIGCDEGLCIYGSNILAGVTHDGMIRSFSLESLWEGYQ